MKKLTFNRYEKKYMLNEDQYLELKSLVNIHMEKDFYMKDDSGNYIYNIYFDNNNNDIISHCIERPLYKEKVRLRSYIKLPLPDDKVFLEVKRKYAGKVYKRRIEMNYQEAYEYCFKGIKPKLKSTIQKQIFSEIDWVIKANELTPKVFIGCLRESYYLNNNDSFRLTIDKKICTRRDDLCFVNKDDDNVLLDNDYLVEIKAESSYPTWLIDFISKNKLHRISFSKYGNEYKNYILGGKIYAA